jgi:D-alanine--poly(phosphoribitol) ligase subunit 2
MSFMTSRWQAARMLDLEQVAAELEAFIRERFEVARDDAAFHRQTHLWEEGYVDSTGAVELIAFIEERYEIALPEDALYDPDFTTIAGMARCVTFLLAC